MINNKGQLNQVFTIIFVLVIMAVIVIFAVKGINGILKDSCNADFISFKGDLTNLISKNKDFGVINEHALFAPCSYYKICFIDSTKPIGDGVTESENMLKQTLKNSYVDGIYTNNVFLFDGDKVTPMGYFPEIQKIYNESNEIVPYMCISQKSGRFNFITEGKGKSIELLFYDLE
jgi:hypothetical protein